MLRMCDVLKNIRNCVSDGAMMGWIMDLGGPVDETSRGRDWVDGCGDGLGVSVDIREGSLGGVEGGGFDT